VLEWDSLSHEPRTSSLHFFEGDPALREGRKVGVGGRAQAGSGVVQALGGGQVDG